MSDQPHEATVGVGPKPAVQPEVSAPPPPVPAAPLAAVAGETVDMAREGSARAIDAAGDVARATAEAVETTGAAMADAADATIDTAASAMHETAAVSVDHTEEAADAAVAPAVALANTLEAAASPAMLSDVKPAAAPSSALFRGLTQMATVISPAETAEKTKAFLGDVQNRMGAAFEKSSRMGEDMVDFAKGNVEAMVASARVAAKAGEVIGQEAAEYSRKSFESAQAMIKSLSSVKSPTELFQLQSDFARSAFDSAVAEASKMSEVMIKFAGEISQPLSNRYALAAEKLKTTAA